MFVRLEGSQKDEPSSGPSRSLIPFGAISWRLLKHVQLIYHALFHFAFFSIFIFLFQIKHPDLLMGGAPCAAIDNVSKSIMRS